MPNQAPHRRARRIPAALLAALMTLFLAAAATGAEAQQGIGFAQAEEGTWHCRAGDPVTALDCARDLCRSEGNGQDCYRTAWCYPAGWSGVVALQLQEFRNNHPVCGAPSREGLLAAMQAYCEHAPFVVSCDVWLIVDPEGNEMEVGEHQIPISAGCDAEAAAFAVGETGDEPTVEAARSAANARTVRLIPPGTAITQDYVPDRLNVELDADDRITRLWCG